MTLRIAAATLVAALTLALGACSSLEFPGVYRIDIDQGNVITQDMVDQLEVGMSRSQVEFIMGTPLVQDPFSPNRWDYIYTMAEEGGPAKRKQLTVLFDGDSLAEIRTTIPRSKNDSEAAQAPQADAAQSAR